MVDVNDGTIYQLSKRLTNEKYAETYLVESSEVPYRKYYKITDLGQERMKELKNIWTSFAGSVNKFIKENGK